jgi:hypothetical protein
VQSTTGGLYLPISGGTINGDLNVLGAVTSGADIISKGGLFVNDTAVGMVFAPLGTARLMQFAPTYTWSWNAADANLTYLSNSTIHLVVNNTDQQFGNELAGMYGHGIYNNVSDERVKVDIQPTTYGLAEIMQLEPIAFKRKAAGRVEDGFSAQQVQKIIPSAVTTIAATADRAELLGVGLDPIVAALVNGMKEQDARIRELEKQLSDMHGGNRPAQPE